MTAGSHEARFVRGDLSLGIWLLRFRRADLSGQVQMTLSTLRGQIRTSGYKLHESRF